jgi:hypothetical protein
MEDKNLDAGKSNEEKEKIRQKAIREEALKVAAYIAIALKNLQANNVIWLPYNFE